MLKMMEHARDQSIHGETIKRKRSMLLSCSQENLLSVLQLQTMVPTCYNLYHQICAGRHTLIWLIMIVQHHRPVQSSWSNVLILKNVLPKQLAAANLKLLVKIIPKNLVLVSALFQQLMIKTTTNRLLLISTTQHHKFLSVELKSFLDSII